VLKNLNVLQSPTFGDGGVAQWLGLRSLAGDFS